MATEEALSFSHQAIRKSENEIKKGNHNSNNHFEFFVISFVLEKQELKNLGFETQIILNE